MAVDNSAVTLLTGGWGYGMEGHRSGGTKLTAAKLRRMTAMQLANLASEMGLPERKCWKLHGGPILKERLIEHILERQAEFNGNDQ